jgi:zinc protease
MKAYIRIGTIIIAAIFVLASCQSGPTETKVPGLEGIPSDADIVSGTLENGLQYYILENSKPARKAELRLIVNAGSVLEDEDQRGLAHFLEHMAFNGTERYPRNELISFLQDIGMEFGPDINAYTSFDETVYMLSVPTDRPGVLTQGFEVLEEWAFNMTIDPEEVVRERGVVMEEWRLGRGANQRILDRILPLLFADSRYAVRLPIGLEEIIASADAERLRRFYEDWYRPELMAIVAVGDFDPAAIEDEIVRRFSPYTNPEPIRERPRYDIPPLDEALFAFESDPEATVTAVEILNRYEPVQVSVPDDYSQLLVENLFYMMINQRLGEIAQRDNPPFLTASVYQANYTRWTAQSGITALVRPDGIERGLEAIATEYARIAQYGFLESELDRAKRDLYSSFESYWKDGENREHREFLGSIQDAYLTGAPLPDLDWEWEQVQRLLPLIDPEDFTALVANRLTDDDRLVIISGPDEINSYALEAAEADAIIAAAFDADLEPWEDNLRDDELVKVVPAAGEIISESYDEGAGIFEWTLSNGARVYVKPTDFKDDEVLFSSFSPGGLSMISDEEYLDGSLASTVVQVSGIGDFSAVDLNKVLAGVNVSISPYINEYEEGTSGSSTRRDFESLLKLNYLYFTAAREDEVAWSSYAGRLEDYLRNQELDPRVQYQFRINDVIFDGHPRARNLRADDVTYVDMNRSLEIYSRRFADGGDFSFVITGAVDPEAIRPLVELWIGGLPGLGSNEVPRDNGMDYFPENVRSEVRAGLETASIVTQVWHGVTEWNYDNLYDLAALTAALDILLVEKVREEVGGTYSIYSTFSLDNIPDEDYRIIVQFSAEPERVDELIGIVNSIIENISSNGISADYVAKVSESQRLNYRENLERNNWWLAQIKFLVSQDLDWRYATDKNEWYDALTAEDIQQSVRRWIDEAVYGEIILFPEGF